MSDVNSFAYLFLQMAAPMHGSNPLPPHQSVIVQNSVPYRFDYVLVEKYKHGKLAEGTLDTTLKMISRIAEKSVKPSSVCAVNEFKRVLNLEHRPAAITSEVTRQFDTEKIQVQRGGVNAH